MFSFVCMYILVLFIQCNKAVENKVHFIGVTKKDSIADKQNLMKVRGFQPKEITGMKYTQDGTFNVDMSGLYFISCRIKLKTQISNTYTLAVNMNRENIKTSSLQSMSTEQKGLFILQVNGVIKVEAKSNIEIFIIPENPTLAFSILENSRISLFQISRKQFIQAFSVSLNNHVDKFRILSYIQYSTHRLWSSKKTAGSFISTNLFSNGYVVAKESGKYILTVNSIFQTHELKVCRHFVTAYGNKNVDLLHVSELAASKQRVKTLNLAGAISLQKNERVRLEFRSSCSDAFLSSSTTYTFTKILMLPGISLVYKTLSYDVGNRWTRLSLHYFKIVSRELTRNVQKEDNYIKVCSPGFVLISVKLLTKTPRNASGLVFKINRTVDFKPDTKIKEVSKNEYIYTMAQSTYRLNEQTMQITGIFRVKQNEYLKFYLRVPQDGLNIVLIGSTITLNYIDYVLPRSLGTVSDFSLPVSDMKWRSLSNCYKLERSTLILQTQSGGYRVQENGIYYVTLAVYFYIKDGEEENLEVSLQNDKKSRDNEFMLLYAIETGVKSKRKISVASTLNLNYNQDLHIKISNYASVKTQCSLQMHFLGHHSSVVGFHAHLDFEFETKKNIGYFDIHSFQRPNNNNNIFDTSDTFNYKTGTHTAHLNGTYLVSVTLIVKKMRLISDEDKVALYLCINRKRNTLFFTERQKKINHSNRDRDAKITLVISGLIELNINDVLSLKLFVGGDENIVIDKFSSFSVVYIDSVQRSQGFSMYRSRMLNKNDFKTISGWTVADGNPVGTFQSGKKESPSISSGQTININKDGVYFISFHLLLHQTGTEEKDISIEFVTKNDTDTFVLKICDIFNNQFQVAETSCHFMMYLREGKKLSFQISSPSGINSTDYYDVTSELMNTAYLSVIRLGEPKSYQFAAAVLENDLEFSKQKQIIKPWLWDSQVTYTGDTGFDSSAGIVTAKNKGWFLFTLNILCRRQFGNATVGFQVQPPIPIGDDHNTKKNVLTSIGQCNEEQPLLSFIGVIFITDIDSQIVPFFDGYGPGDIVSLQTTFSFARLPQRIEHTKKFIAETMMSYTKIQIGFVKTHIVKWSEESESNTIPNREIPLQSGGIFFFTLNIVLYHWGVKNQLKNVDIVMKLNNIEVVYKSHYITTTEGHITITAGGPIISRETDGSYLTVILNTKDSIEVSNISSIAVTLLHKEHLNYPLILLKFKKNQRFPTVPTWFHVSFPVIDEMSMFYHHHHIIIPRVSGVYLLNCNIIVSCSKLTHVELAINIDREIAVKIIRRVFHKNTLSITTTMFLRQGSMITVKIFPSKIRYMTIEKESLLSLVLIESPQGEDESSMLPVITRELLKGSIIKPDVTMKLECDAIGGGDTTYAWYFNNTRLPEKTSSFMYVNLSLGNGKYQCQSLRDGLGPISNVAILNEKQINECLDTRSHCTAPSSTCIDKPIGYECGCVDIRYTYKDGECRLLGKQGDDPNPSIPIAIFILIPFFLITILIVFICTVYVCLKRRNANVNDPERIAFSSSSSNHNPEDVFSANQNPDDITMRSLNSLNDGSTEQLPQGAIGNTPRLSSGDVVDRAMLLEHNDEVSSRDRRTYSTRSYPANHRFSGYHDFNGEDPGNRSSCTEHRWKKLMSASTKV